MLSSRYTASGGVVNAGDVVRNARQKIYYFFCMNIQDEITKFYDYIAPESFSKWFNNETLLPILKKFVNKLKETPLILDLGCGTGGESKRLVNLGASVIGIDLSDKSLKYAKENVLKAQFIKMNINRLAFKKNYFDGILEAGVLFHFNKEEQTLIIKELLEILKPAGIFLSIYPIGNDEGIQDIVINEHNFKRYRRLLHAEEWIQFLLNNGFKKYIIHEDNINAPPLEWKAFEFYK